MIKDLVSIITPCWNGAHMIGRLLDSVLAQDYPSVEMQVVDDGSDDNLEEVVSDYVPRFKAHGYDLTYLRQDHRGQSAALDLGLKHVRGEYLLWPDSDDYFTPPYAISRFVSELCELGDDFAVVRSLPRYVDEHTGEELHWDLQIDLGERQFENILFGKNFYIVPINYMIRLAAFDRVCPGRHIYTGRRPQNLQILEPLLYEYKCHTILKQLSTVVVRSNSDSHSVKSVEETMDDMTGFFEIHLHTVMAIATMPAATKVKYVKAITEDLLNKQQTCATRHDRPDVAKVLFCQMRDAGLHVTWKNKVLYLLMRCSPPLVRWLTKHF